MDETHFDEIPVDDVEKLRAEVIDLAEKGEVKYEKIFLKNKKKCDETTLRKIMGDYAEGNKEHKKISWL